MLYFADSYAFVEWTKGNPNYRKYFTQHELLTTRLNLMELYNSVLSEDSEEKAEEYFETFLPLAVEIGDDILKKAVKFRRANRKTNISYIDAIGYEIARERKIRFLTGDKEFKEMENVEFVK